MSKSVKTKILIFFLVAFISLTPLVVLFPRVTAITDYAYEDEKGNLESPIEDEYSGMGYGNAFDMFGEATVPETTLAETSVTQSSTKEYQVAVKKNKRTPTEPGSKENISTTTTTREYETETLDYYSVGKNQNIKGEKLRTLPEPSSDSKKRQLSKGYLIAIKNPDPDYKYDGKAVEMTEKDLDIAERLVMGEPVQWDFTDVALLHRLLGIHTITETLNQLMQFAKDMDMTEALSTSLIQRPVRQ